jgi:hypothetical protein
MSSSNKPHNFNGGHAQGFQQAKQVTTGITGSSTGTSRTAGKVIAISGTEAGDSAITLCRVVAATDDGRQVTMMEPTEQRGSSTGSVVYAVTGRVQNVANADVICALDGTVFGSGLFDLTPMHRTFVTAAMHSRAASMRRAEASGIRAPGKRPLQADGGEQGASSAPKVARVTDLHSALGRNAIAQAPSGIRQEQMAIWGLESQPRNFTSADKKLWTKQERSMFSGQAQMHGLTHASAFMRDYFKRNEGKPLAPQCPPKQGAFALYRKEQFQLLGCSAGGFKGTGRAKKSYGKQVGASWRALSAQEQRPYQQQFAALEEEFERKSEVYEAELEAWEAQREEQEQAEVEGSSAKVVEGLGSDMHALSPKTPVVVA